MDNHKFYLSIFKNNKLWIYIIKEEKTYTMKYYEINF